MSDSIMNQCQFVRLNRLWQGLPQWNPKHTRLSTLSIYLLTHTAADHEQLQLHWSIDLLSVAYVYYVTPLITVVHVPKLSLIN